MFLFITKALIRVCGAQADLRLCWSYASRGTYRRVVREANSDQGHYCFHMKGKSINSESVKLEDFSLV